MKNVSQEYRDLEEKSTRKPVELYKIWQGSSYWYYTNGDVSVSFGGQTCNPGVIARGTAQYNSDLDSNTLQIQFARNTDPIDGFIDETPYEDIWIEVSRLFRDQSPLEKSVIFIGIIKTAAFKGVSAEVTCVGFERFLKQTVPLWRYQPQCNTSLYSSKCGVNKSSYDLSASSVTVSSDGLTVTHADFATLASGHLTLGYLVWGNYKRMIVAHSGNSVTIRYAIPGFTTGENVTVYAGCDKRITTCIDKFNNINNFRGMPYIPLDNPVLWTASGY